MAIFPAHEKSDDTEGSYITTLQYNDCTAPVYRYHFRLTDRLPDPIQEEPKPKKDPKKHVPFYRGLKKYKPKQLALRRDARFE